MEFSVLRRQVARLMGSIVLAVTLGGPSLAQDSFTPRLYVNDRAISSYEVEQRALFLRVLRAPGNPEEEALKALVEDRLRQTEAERLEIKLTEDDVQKGMTEFASRANLTPEQFVAELAKAGVAAETLRDFVSAGLLWRQVVRARFLGQVPINDNDIDRALEASARPRALQVLVSELVISAPEDKVDSAMALAQEISENTSGEAAFAAAVRRYSAAPTAGSGGRLDWLPLANLPPDIRQKILALGPGEVSEPVPVPGAIVLFLLRDVAEDKTAEPIEVTIEWAEYLVSDSADAIEKVRANADECNDLNALASGLPEDRLTISKGPLAEVPGDVALELARLDPGEFSSALTRGGFRRIIMLCGRQQTLEPEPTREQIRDDVINEKLEGMAEGYLEELRSAAIIREP